MFATVSIVVVGPFGKLPPPEFKLLAMLSRYSNAAGEACPTLEQLAADADTSKPTVSRVMAELEKRKAITRHRARNGRYFYAIAKEFRPCWPSQLTAAPANDVQEMEHEIIAQPHVPDPEHEVAAASGVPDPEHRVSQRETQQVSLISKLKNARARELRTARNEEENQRRARDWVKTRFWLRDGTWGPRPDQPGCTLPPDLLAWCLAERAKRSALDARVASAHSGRQEESLHARREGAAGTGTGLPTRERLHALRGV